MKVDTCLFLLLERMYYAIFIIVNAHKYYLTIHYSRDYLTIHYSRDSGNLSNHFLQNDMNMISVIRNKMFGMNVHIYMYDPIFIYIEKHGKSKEKKGDFSLHHILYFSKN